MAILEALLSRWFPEAEEYHENRESGKVHLNTLKPNPK
jgi:hypothetical protein